MAAQHPNKANTPTNGTEITTKTPSNAPDPETTCRVVSTVGVALGSYAAAAALARAGPAGLAIGKALGGYAGGKLADYACQQVIEGAAPAPAAASKAPPSVVPSSPALAPNDSGATPAAAHVKTPVNITINISSSNTVPATTTVRARATPDGRGHEGAYQIHPGDTLSAIAKAKGLALEQLLASNPQITDANVVRGGQWIHLPGQATGHGAPAQGPVQGQTQPLARSTAMEAAESFAQRLQLTAQEKSHFMQAVQDRWQRQNSDLNLQPPQESASRQPHGPAPVLSNPPLLRPSL
jgi:LysM repeat protein